MFDVKLTDDRRRALRDAAALLRAQAEGLRTMGSANTVKAFEHYVVTLERLASAGGTVSVSAEDSTHVEKAKHILEGVRDGLSNADFESRAGAVDRTIGSLDEIVTEVNTQASR